MVHRSSCCHSNSRIAWARDERVRLIRSDFLMTGVIFLGEVDTDILFDYGIFTRPQASRPCGHEEATAS